MKSFNTAQQQLDNYREAKRLFWNDVYKKGDVSLYSRETIPQNSHRLVNIEHVYPMSWVTNAVGCGDRDTCRRYSDLFNQIEADIHNMYPARKDLNYIRSSLSFGMVEGEERDFNDFDFEVDMQKRVIEPTIASRGNIARAMFYMADAYDLTIFKRQRDLLKAWHEQDPPSKRERKRNDLIEAVQGNRNYFIDHPKDVRFL